MRAERLEKLIEICRNLGKSDDVDTLLFSVVEAARNLTNSQVSFLLVYEQETELLKYVAGSPLPPESYKNLRLPLDTSLSGWVFKKGKPLILHKSQQDHRVSTEIQKILNIRILNILSVPLIFKGAAIGVLEAINKIDQTEFDEEDTFVLETLASQAAVTTLSTLLLIETKQAYEEVKDLDRMKSDFIAIASHELRTPLSLIIGHASYLREIINEQEYCDHLDIIIQNSNRLKTILDDLATINTFQSGSQQIQRGPIALDKIINKIVSAYQTTAQKKNLTLASKLPTSELIIEGDEEKIAIVINNLVSNAITFTNNNGHILVSAEQMPGYVQVSVMDDGIGIPSKEVPRVFDRFYQVQAHLTRKHGGMGLGLSVAKAIIEMHNGEIWVESIEGKGSKFSFLLPNQLKSTASSEKVFNL